MLALNTAFRESMLLIERQHGHAQEAYVERSALVERTIVLRLIDDLYQRLQSLTASEPNIADHGRAIATLVMRYRAAADTLYQTLAKQGDSYETLAEAKANTLYVMRELSEETEQRIEKSRQEIDEIFTMTGVIAVVLSIVVIVGVAIVMITMIRRHFQHPLLQMTKGIEGFSDGNFSGRIQLGRNDEWSSLEQAFNALAENAETLLKDLSTEIATRERIEADLRDQRRFLESILENIPSTIFVKDAENLRYIRLNKAGEGLLGASRDHVIGKTDSDLFDAENARNSSPKIGPFWKNLGTWMYPRSCGRRYRAAMFIITHVKCGSRMMMGSRFTCWVFPMISLRKSKLMKFSARRWTVQSVPTGPSPNSWHP